MHVILPQPLLLIRDSQSSVQPCQLNLFSAAKPLTRVGNHVKIIMFCKAKFLLMCQTSAPNLG